MKAASAKKYTLRVNKSSKSISLNVSTYEEIVIFIHDKACLRCKPSITYKAHSVIHASEIGSPHHHH